MKYYSLVFLFTILVPFSILAQKSTWAVKAIDNRGNSLPINVYLEDGTTVPVFAIYEDENDHFMDVKGVHNGEIISIKLIRSDDILIPVKGITGSGDILNVKAEDSQGNILDVKGVSRDGNIINIAAIKGEEEYVPLMAISQDGLQRSVKGVKFKRENYEMNVGNIDIVAHLKAFPTIDVGDIDEKWEIKSRTNEGKDLNLVAINKKGKEYPVKAFMTGTKPYLMNVRGEASFDIFVKFVKDNDDVFVRGIDEFGRFYEIKAKASDGNLFEVIGGQKKGNIIPVYVVGSNSEKFPVKAFSSEGHEFDVKGIKVLKSEVEGFIPVLEAYIKYYAHIKALAPSQANNE